MSSYYNTNVNSEGKFETTEQRNKNSEEDAEKWKDFKGYCSRT